MSANQTARILGPQFAPSWHRPWFRYIDPVPGAEAGTPPAPKVEDLGFPKDTPVEQMTDPEKVAYWKNQSKVQQGAREAAERGTAAYAKFGTVEDLQGAADAAESARLEALDENGRAIEAAKTAVRAEVLAETGNKHLDTAVSALLVALTKSADESFDDAQARVAGAIEFADITKFVGENGTLDAAKVQTFAKSIGSAGNGDVSNPSNAAWGAQYDRDHAGRIAPAPGATGSVAAMKQTHLDRMKNNKA